MSDVDKLRAVAEVLSRARLQCFVVFAKLAPLSDMELERCQRVNDRYNERLILFSKRELEPYDPYERATDKAGKQITAVSLQHMARATRELFF